MRAIFLFCFKNERYVLRSLFWKFLLKNISLSDSFFSFIEQQVFSFHFSIVIYLFTKLFLLVSPFWVLVWFSLLVIFTCYHHHHHQLDRPILVPPSQPLRSGRIWHKVDMKAKFNRFEFRVFLSHNRSKRVRTQVALLCSLSGKYPWEKDEPPYHPRYYLPTPPLGQDITQGQSLCGV